MYKHTYLFLYTHTYVDKLSKQRLTALGKYKMPICESFTKAVVTYILFLKNLPRY